MIEHWVAFVYSQPVDEFEGKAWLLDHVVSGDPKSPNSRSSESPGAVKSPKSSSASTGFGG